MHRWLFFLFSLLVLLGGSRAFAAMPADPFDRLLYRLDHAPVNLSALEPGARQMNEIHQDAQDFQSFMDVAAPSINAVAHSQALSLLAQLPVIGREIAAAQDAVDAGLSVDEGFKWLLQEDEHQLGPLRDAVVASARLRRTRSRDDLPAVVDALDRSLPLLQSFQDSFHNQGQRIAALELLLDKAAPLLRNYGRTHGSLPDILGLSHQGLAGIAASFDTMSNQFGQLHSFVGDCAADAHTALAPAPAATPDQQQGQPTNQ